MKVLKDFADYRDLALADFWEGLVLHVFDRRCPFQQESLHRIKRLKSFYGLHLDSCSSHRLTEASARGSRKKTKGKKEFRK